jgi:NAD(P)-dependent dehydrogenase (short-subunit alcohol dehydrogenase family)
MARPSEDPRKKEVPQPFPEQHQEPPGSEQAMHPRPDYGEKSYRGSGKLAGKKALITGGDSGIGRAVALAFAREGADIAIAYLPEEEADARETAQVIEREKRRCLAIAGDIRDPAHCRALVTRMVRELGGVDVLVNNAAYQMTHSSFVEMRPEEIDRVFRTNVYAMFYITQAAVPHMRPGSTIINTASIQAYQPKPYLLHYAASKAAIVAFAKGLSQELAEKGIRVNAVAPGPVWTPLIPSTMDVEHFGESAALKRAAQPAEMAPIYVLLACNDSSYVTGMVYGATGGQLLP